MTAVLARQFGIAMFHYLYSVVGIAFVSLAFVLIPRADAVLVEAAVAPIQGPSVASQSAINAISAAGSSRTRREIAAFDFVSSPTAAASLGLLPLAAAAPSHAIHRVSCSLGLQAWVSCTALLRCLIVLRVRRETLALEKLVG